MTLQVHLPKPGSELRPYFKIPISAGTAAAVEQVVEWINIDEYVRAGVDSYYIRVVGDSMEDIGIFDGDLLVVRRAEAAKTGDVVIAEINGEFTVKKLDNQRSGLYLVPANGKYKKRQIVKTDYFAIWGVVTYIIHKV